MLFLVEANEAYALYLIAKHRFHASYNEDMHLTSLWFFYASLVSLYTGSFESSTGIMFCKSYHTSMQN